MPPGASVSSCAGSSICSPEGAPKSPQPFAASTSRASGFDAAAAFSCSTPDFFRSAANFARNRGFRVGVQNLSKRRVAVAARKKFFESFGDVRVLRRNLVAERRRQVRGNVHVRRSFAKLRPDRHPLRELAESRGRNITRFRSAGHRSRFFLAETPVSCSISLVRFGIGSAFGHFKIAAILSEVRALPKRLFVLITPQLHGMSGAHVVKISVFGLLQINQHAGSGVR